MNIQEAKIQIKNTISAYFTKDEFGEYLFPIVRQRPIFLMGPPGIGKTAIMEQISAEMNIGLLSYPMTHHTRQSVLGMAYIDKKNYDGTEYEVTEYTMSEIIASIYDFIAETNTKEGILFLDEVNCVEESLQPVMLQFLQNKVFGRHRLPDGWIVVTAGNPPEYNDAGRDFDMVTWDRLKRIDVVPDFKPWRAYAYEKLVNQAVISYLENYKLDFYRVETLKTGKFTFVSARAWEDLSQMLVLNEMNNIKSNDNLISQYIQNPRVCRDFCNFYRLYNESAERYPIGSILKGRCKKGDVKKAGQTSRDEKSCLKGLLYEELNARAIHVMHTTKALNQLRRMHNAYFRVAKNDEAAVDSISQFIKEQWASAYRFKKAQSKTHEELNIFMLAIRMFEDELNEIKGMDSNITAKDERITAFLKESHEKQTVDIIQYANGEVADCFNNVFLFFEKALSSADTNDLIGKFEMSPNVMGYLSKYGYVKYLEHRDDAAETPIEKTEEMSKSMEDYVPKKISNTQSVQ